ncbi:MAG: hypothetical protein QXQ18_00330 [Candidatus Aenigmatarchaeota archaeon]
MVNIKIMLHNISHIVLPILMIRLIHYYLPKIDFQTLILVVVAGCLFPDIDHFTMRKLYKNLGFWKFIKEVMKADRYRKTFLPFHNFLTILIILISLPIANLINTFIAIFLLSMLAHLILDFLSDLMIIKMHSHWKFKSWL